MKAYLSFLLAVILSNVSLATTITASSSGNWSSTSTWSGGVVPTSSDDVVIGGGYSVTVNANASCHHLTVNNTAGVTPPTTVLTINSGVTLTVTGNVAHNVTVTGLTIGACQVNVSGTLAVTGNYAQTNGFSVLTNAATLTIGTSSNSGTVTIGGNFSQTNGFLTALGNANKVTVAQGVLDINGNINFTAGAINLLATNEINVTDNGVNDNKTKAIYLGGNFTNTDQGTLSLSDTDGDAPYTFYLDGTAAQNLYTQNIYYKNVTIANSGGAEVNLIANLSNTNFAGTITVNSGSVLNTKSYNLDAINAYAGQISIASGGTLRVENSAGVPTQKVSGSYVCAPNSLGVVEFYSTSTLTVFDEDFEFTKVIMSGSGTKTYSTNSSRQIDNSVMKVQSIDVTGGTFVIPDAKKLQLSASGSKVISLASGTTLAIQGDFTNLDASFDLNIASTVWYQKNGDQTVYALTNGGSPEPYGNLMLARASGSGTALRNILASTNIDVEGKVTIQDYANLVIKQGASLELLSNASKTAYIGAIGSTAAITYEGSPAGVIIANKYVSLPDANYRDFSSPIKNMTLDTWKTAGLDLTGFTGSQYPASAWVNAYYYDETYTGTLEDGWIPADNITNDVVQENGSSQITNGSWRVYSGYSGGLTLTLSDAGQIRTGDVDFLTTFNHGSESRTWDDGWNMLGNPYPAPINWGKIYRDASNSSSFGSDGIQSTYYVWKPSDTGIPDDEEDSYGFFNAATGVGSNLDSIIPAFQGFWVKTHHASNSSASYPLHLKETHKEDYGTSKFHKDAAEGGPQGLVTVLLKSSQYTDKVWFHPWPEATVGVDEIYDVNRMSTTSNFPSVNFSQEGTPLFLWVNALPYKAYTLEVPLYVSSTINDSLTLTFQNMQSFIDEFGCVKLLDKETGIITDLTADSSYTFYVQEGYAGERFLLQMSRNIENKISTQNGICASQEDGLLNVDLSEYPDDVDMSLFKNGTLFKTFVGNIDLIDENLGAGDYTLVNNLGDISCSMSTYNFTLTTGAPIVAAFTSVSQAMTHADIQFDNTSQGAIQWVWDFGDGSATSAEFNPKHAYEHPGTYVVKLSAYNADACEPSVTSKQIVVESGTGIGQFAQTDKYSIRTNESGFSVVNNTAESGTIRVFSLDGKLITTQSLSTGNQSIALPATTGVWMVVVSTPSGSYQQKIVH